MKAWLKGGLIGLGMLIISYVSLVITEALAFLQYPGYLIIGDSLKIYDAPLSIINVTFICASLLNIIIYFSVGALIGWLIGRRKK